MLQNIKLNSKKIAAVTGGAVAGVVGTVSNVLAVGTADATVTAALTTTADNATATLQGIAPVALTVFGVIFVWRLGMRVFRMLAK